MENLEFEAEDLYYSLIEEKITKYYDLGYADDSNFTELKNGINSSLWILATKGSIEFSAVAGKNKEGKYLISIHPSKIKRNNNR